MKKMRVSPLLIALSISFLSFLSADAQYNNSANNPLRSVLPGVGTTVGIDLKKELLNGTVLPQANGGTGVSTSAATNGQLLIGKTSDHSLNLATLTGTANQVVVTNGAASITLSLPQSINTTSSPTFNALTLTNQLSVANGGTGATSLTAHGVVFGEGTAAVSVSSTGTSGIPLIGQGAAADPIFGTALVAGGGTGATSLTAHGVLVGEGTSAVTPLSVGTNGQVLLGSAGADPAFGTLTSTGGTLAFTTGAAALNIDTKYGIQSATYNLTSANITGMFGAPVSVLAGISSKTIVPVAITMAFTEAGAAYGGGGNISFTYHGSSTCTGTVASTALTAASGSTYSQFMPVSNSVAAQNLGIDITNASGAFTSSGATGTATITIYYFTY